MSPSAPDNNMFFVTEEVMKNISPKEFIEFRHTMENQKGDEDIQILNLRYSAFHKELLIKRKYTK